MDDRGKSHDRQQLRGLGTWEYRTCNHQRSRRCAARVLLQWQSGFLLRFSWRLLSYEFERIFQQALYRVPLGEILKEGGPRIPAALANLVSSERGDNFRFIQFQIEDGQVEGMSGFRVGNFPMCRRFNRRYRWTGGARGIVNRRGGS